MERLKDTEKPGAVAWGSKERVDNTIIVNYAPVAPMACLWDMTDYRVG